MIVTAAKKPKYVKAVKWDGTNADECIQFLGNFGKHLSGPNMILIDTLHGRKRIQKPTWILSYGNNVFDICDTFEDDFDIVTDRLCVQK